MIFHHSKFKKTYYKDYTDDNVYMMYSTRAQSISTNIVFE